MISTGQLPSLRTTPGTHRVWRDGASPFGRGRLPTNASRQTRAVSGRSVNLSSAGLGGATRCSSRGGGTVVGDASLWVIAGWPRFGRDRLKGTVCVLRAVASSSPCSPPVLLCATRAPRSAALMVLPVRGRRRCGAAPSSVVLGRLVPDLLRTLSPVVVHFKWCDWSLS